MNITLEVKKTDERDWETIKTARYNNKNVASFRKQAKKISLDPNIQEVTIESRGDDDPIIQEWYENGKMSFKMF